MLVCTGLYRSRQPALDRAAAGSCRAPPPPPFSTRQVKVCVIDSGLRRTHQDFVANDAGGWNRCMAACCAVSCCAALCCAVLHRAVLCFGLDPVMPGGEPLQARTAGTRHSRHGTGLPGAAAHTPRLSLHYSSPFLAAGRGRTEACQRWGATCTQTIAVSAAAATAAAVAAAAAATAQPPMLLGLTTTRRCLCRCCWCCRVGSEAVDKGPPHLAA